jgi:tRNA threonylcarbamoyladenosine biosynthesis protein TsaB
VLDSESPLILSLETATLKGSVALTLGSQVLALHADEAQASHSVRLLQTIAEVLEDAGGVRLSDVELFAVASGPGSFTGLRIGLATVKSFAATLSRPCVGVPTLHGVAHSYGPSERTLAMLPAGRGEVFAQLLAVDEAGAVTPLGEAVHQPPQELLESVGNYDRLVLAGEGAQQHELLIEAAARRANFKLAYEKSARSEMAESSGGLWVLARPIEGLAVNIAALAHLCYRSGELMKAEQLRALYVRPSDAELNA